MAIAGTYAGGIWAAVCSVECAEKFRELVDDEKELARLSSLAESAQTTGSLPHSTQPPDAAKEPILTCQQCNGCNVHHAYYQTIDRDAQKAATFCAYCYWTTGANYRAFQVVKSKQALLEWKQPWWNTARFEPEKIRLPEGTDVVALMLWLIRLVQETNDDKLPRSWGPQEMIMIAQHLQRLGYKEHEGVGGDCSTQELQIRWWIGQVIAQLKGGMWPSEKLLMDHVLPDSYKSLCVAHVWC